MGHLRITVAQYGNEFRNPQGRFKNSVLLTNFGSISGARLVGDVTDLSPLIEDNGINWTGVSEMAGKVTEADILVCQAGVSLPVMQRFREVNPDGLIVLQRDSTHCRDHLRLVKEAMDRHGIHWEHQYERDGNALLNRECAEYDLADRIFTLSRWVTDSFNSYEHTQGKAMRFSSQLADARLWWPPPSWQAREQTFTAVFVGSLGLRKGTLDLLEAWRRFWPRCPSARLILAGAMDGSEPEAVHDAVRQSIARTPQVMHVGWANPPEQTRQLYQRAHVFVTAAVEEGSTMPGVEAPLCGLPIIATPNAGIDMLLPDDYSTGWRVQPANPPELECALLSAAAAFKTGELEEMGNAARAAALKQDVDSYARGFCESLEDAWCVHLLEKTDPKDDVPWE